MHIGHRARGALTLLVSGLLLARIVLAATPQDRSTATLAETVEWIRSQLDDDRIDTGIRIRTMFGADGCRVSFRKDGGTVTLVTAAFNLKDIAYIDVVEHPGGTLWTGVSLSFKTDRGQRSIARGDLSVTNGRLVKSDAASFEWHLGSVQAGTDTTLLRTQGEHLIAAFSHAVGLCGGAVKRGPF